MHHNDEQEPQQQDQQDSSYLNFDTLSLISKPKVKFSLSFHRFWCFCLWNFTWFYQFFWFFLLISYAIWPILGLLSNTWGGLWSHRRRNSVQLYSFSSGSSSLPRYLLLPFLYFDPWDETYWFPTLKSSGFRNIFCTCFKNRNPIDRYRNLSFWFCVWFIYELRNPNLSIGIYLLIKHPIRLFSMFLVLDMWSWF